MTAAPTRRRAARPSARARRLISPRRVPALPALLVAGWAVLGVAWAMANPPFLSPDEPAHYLRAVAVGEGRLAATPDVAVPPRRWGEWRDPQGATCNATDAEQPATCVTDVVPNAGTTTVHTTAGGYPPLYYVLPGAAIRVADDVFSATRAARLAGALPSLAFLALATALLAARESMRVSLLGLLVTVTPMVLFIAASVNSSSLEIAAGIAFFAALLRIARGEPAPWVWAAAGAAGVALALSRATGALWLVLDLLLVAALVGPRGVVRTARALPRAVAAAGVVLLAATVANRMWEQVYGNEITQQGTLGTAAGEAAEPTQRIQFWIVHGFQQLDRIFREQVGVFGWLDTPMPNPSYPAWQAMIAALVGLALVVGTRRERWVLAAAVALSLGVTVFISASLIAATGMDVQGRHVLPFAVVVPLLAGEIVYRNRARLALVDLGVLFVWFAVAAGTLHAMAWYANGYRQSVGTAGPRFFVAHAQWSPPLGWWPWLVLAVAGATLVALAGWPRGAPSRRLFPRPRLRASSELPAEES